MPLMFDALTDHSSLSMVVYGFDSDSATSGSEASEASLKRVKRKQGAPTRVQQKSNKKAASPASASSSPHSSETEDEEDEQPPVSRLDEDEDESDASDASFKPTVLPARPSVSSDDDDDDSMSSSSSSSSRAKETAKSNQQAKKADLPATRKTLAQMSHQDPARSRMMQASIFAPKPSTAPAPIKKVSTLQFSQPADGFRLPQEARMDTDDALVPDKEEQQSVQTRTRKPYRARRIPYAESVLVAGNRAESTEASQMLAHSFRAGWAPNGMLVHSGIVSGVDAATCVRLWQCAT